MRVFSNNFTSKEEKENAANYVEFIEDQFDIISGIKFPIKVGDIQKFVNQNANHKLCINLYTVWGDDIKSIVTNVKSKNDKALKSENRHSVYIEWMPNLRLKP